MREGYLETFRMQAIKVDKSGVETYSDEELFALLKKPNIKKCSFTEYQCWVMTNFLFSTAVRQRSLMHIRVKDIDFDNCMVHVTVTKNRKNSLVPFNQTLSFDLFFLSVKIKKCDNRSHRTEKRQLQLSPNKNNNERYNPLR